MFWALLPVAESTNRHTEPASAAAASSASAFLMASLTSVALSAMPVLVAHPVIAKRARENSVFFISLLQWAADGRCRAETFQPRPSGAPHVSCR